MHPELFTIFGKTITTYGLMAMLGLLAAIGTWTWARRKTPAAFPPDLPANLGVLLILAGMVGARAAYVIANWSAYAAAPSEIFRVDHGGLIFYGGLVGASLALVAYAFLAKIPLWRLADFAILGLGIGHAFGRVGCFLFGCCHGAPATAHPWLGVKYPPDTPLGAETGGVPLYPVQLWEAAWLFLVWALLLAIWWRGPSRRRPGVLFALYLLLYPPARFAIEFLRGDARQAWGGLNVAQWLSIALFAAGAVLLAVLPKRKDAAP